MKPNARRPARSATPPQAPTAAPLPHDLATLVQLINEDADLEEVYDHAHALAAYLSTANRPAVVPTDDEWDALVGFEMGQHGAAAREVRRVLRLLKV